MALPVSTAPGSGGWRRQLLVDIALWAGWSGSREGCQRPGKHDQQEKPARCGTAQLVGKSRGAAVAAGRNENDSCNGERIHLLVLDNTRRSRVKLSQGNSR